MSYGIVQRHPSKLTTEFIEKFCALIREGATVRCAAALLKLHPDSVASWVNTGRGDPNCPTHAFYLQVCEAEAECEAEAVTQWRAINEQKKDYRSIQGFLAMRHKWQAPSVKVESTLTVNHVDRPDLETLNDVDLQNYIEAREAADMILATAGHKQRLLEKTTIDIEPDDVEEVD